MGRVKSPAAIGEYVSPGFEPVAEEFAENFATRDELGAACSVRRDGELVVDLWGGIRDEQIREVMSSPVHALT